MVHTTNLQYLVPAHGTVPLMCAVSVEDENDDILSNSDALSIPGVALAAVIPSQLRHLFSLSLRAPQSAAASVRPALRA